ncbi:hypothetical protein AZE42_10707 [Rhizopogon vesiculosus]|uniref:Secreted protein n=1 Tax=Rhizopogon vesiculosus TaxID=180088 RepID=A0A1J8PJ48_9AGAM|nr:hypothetical protein AZE42_10707 [Rhizopogon vesiculosus]
MRFILLSTVLLAQAFTALSQQPAQFAYDAQSNCEERAKAAGMPTDGWKVVFDNGQLMCRRESITQFPDGGGERKYHNPCINNPVCGSGKSLGINDGQQLSTVRETPFYSKGGFFQDIPFKVCKSTDDCAPGKIVEMGDSFYLEDQQGRYNDPKATKGWINNAANGAHIAFTLDPKSAGVFGGIPTCGGGECAIKVLGGPTRSPNVPTCPAVSPGISFDANPKMHDPIRFSEVTCDDYEVPLTSGISPNVN